MLKNGQPRHANHTQDHKIRPIADLNQPLLSRKKLYPFCPEILGALLIRNRGGFGRKLPNLLRKKRHVPVR